MKPKIIAYILTHNCESMLEKAYNKIPKDLVDDIVVCDDYSSDNTIKIADKLHLKISKNSGNKGYGGNVKNALSYCFKHGASYAVEVHGDGAQFNPVAIRDAIPLLNKEFDFILGSRFMITVIALKNGMPIIRYIANRVLSFFDRITLRLPLSEFHTGFRIYSKNLFFQLPIGANSDDYLFSFEVIAQAAYFKLKIGEVPVEADYKSEHTSHNLFGAAIYAFKSRYILLRFLLSKYCLVHSEQFPGLNK